MMTTKHGLKWVGLIAGLFLMGGTACTGDFMSNADRRDMKCDSSGCWFCEGSSCEEYRCDETHQCPMQTFCSSDHSCRPGDDSNSPNVGCRSHDDCPTGKLCTLDGACVVSPNGGPVTADTTGGDTSGAGDISTTDDAQGGDGAATAGDGQTQGDAQTTDTTLPQHPDDVCLSNADCGLTGTCVNGGCFFGCRADGSCPPGQECTADDCRDREVAENACTFNGECGTSHVCQEGTCYRTCEETTECGANERCTGGLCEANTLPVIQCSGPGSCPNGLGCMDGKCVSPCNAAASCNSDAFSCAFGYCMPAPSCFEAADCGGADCVNGACAP